VPEIISEICCSADVRNEVAAEVVVDPRGGGRMTGSSSKRGSVFGSVNDRGNVNCRTGSYIAGCGSWVGEAPT